MQVANIRQLHFRANLCEFSEDKQQSIVETCFRMGSFAELLGLLAK